MTLCSACTLVVTGTEALCPHHTMNYEGDQWAVGNRIVCDLVHRGKAPARLTPSERDGAFSLETTF